MEGVQHSVFTLILEPSGSEALLDSVLGKEPGVINKIQPGEYLRPMNYTLMLEMRAALSLINNDEVTSKCHGTYSATSKARTE